MRKAKADDRTFDLFEAPAPRPARTAAQNYRDEVAHLVSEVTKATDKDRWAIAAEMSRLTGLEVSKHMIDAWSAESREGHNIPLYLAPVLEHVCGSQAFTERLAEIRGGRAIFGADTYNAEIGRLEALKDEIERRIALTQQQRDTLQ